MMNTMCAASTETDRKASRFEIDARGDALTRGFAIQASLILGGLALLLAADLILLAFVKDRTTLGVMRLIAKGAPILMVLAVPVLAMSYRRRVRAVVRMGFKICPRCLHSLRNLRPVGECPECGRPYEMRPLQRAWLQSYRRGRPRGDKRNV